MTWKNSTQYSQNSPTPNPNHANRLSTKQKKAQQHIFVEELSKTYEACKLSEDEANPTYKKTLRS